MLLGVADEQTPRIREELAALAPLFASATVLVDDQATLAALHARAASVSDEVQDQPRAACVAMSTPPEMP